MSTISELRPPKAATGAVVVLVATLATIYMVSQLLRNSIGVIAPDLAQEVGLSASQIGILSSAFFFAFAAAQLPLGVAIDRYGPKRCMVVCAVVVIAGALVFAAAATPAGLLAGRILMGLGTSCYLMAPLALYARRFAADRFATFAGCQMGMGSIGTLLATAPLALSAAAVGWRATFVGMAVVMGIALVLVALVVREDDDTGAAPVRQESFWQSLAGIRAACATDSVGLLFLAHMTAYSSFVLIVGLWGGPYLSHVYGLGLTERGTLLLVPAITQVVGMVIWGRADRLFGSYKAPVLIGAGTTCALLWFLALADQRPLPALIATLAVFGFFAGYTPLVVAHGKSLFPPHLVGRGMTLLNMGSMGGVFVSQTVTGRAIDLFPAEAGVYPLASYRLVFALQAVCLLTTCIAYLWARDPSVHRRERATVK